ncbi:glutathione peroxidase [Desmospora profundinema]|uniref:Glutathione peroxidase n=1 Tax=Desmospora profundinema TaxID=1571184 RepID=A0ABU1IK36_9BACL|nr:glutathione peroxidase [Desmospora profundinema]MDR6225136.1 glutathione peroxidase [Desmospora profundinema]
MSVYDYSAVLIGGEEKSLSDYKGRVLLIVNTASKCGFTPQYRELQALYDQYREQGLEVLGFPCNQFLRQEPASHEEIWKFCHINYGVSFPLFEKVHVKGKNIHPLYRYLTRKAPGFLSKKVKWNFTKFLVDRQGSVIKRYAPTTKPQRIRKAIEKALSS